MLNRLKYHFFKFFRPLMYRVTSLHGQKLKSVRLGNTTQVSSWDNLFLSDLVYIGHYCFIDSSQKITIGKGVQICGWTSILNHSSHIAIRLYGENYNQDNMKAYNLGSVEIGDFTFIGPHSIVMPNSKIGKGVLISAYSYVEGDIPDFAIVGGNPAKIIGDTRTMDEKYLIEFPELRKNYDNWAKK
ncbi:MAG: acyltransferase [Bacteroidota bacterium]